MLVAFIVVSGLACGGRQGGAAGARAVDRAAAGVPAATPARAAAAEPVRATAPTAGELRVRRERAMDAFGDGILLVRAARSAAWSEDSFRQHHDFYYFTGLENTLGAVLALDGRARQAWLLLPTKEPGLLGLRAPEAAPGQERELGVDHVGPLSEIDQLFTADLSGATMSRPVLYARSEWAVADVPVPAGDTGGRVPPLSARAMTKTYGLPVAMADERLSALMGVQSPSEQANARAAARASGAALLAGMRAVREGVTQRRAEGAVVQACLDAGARQSFCPWVMSGPNTDLLRAFSALARYDRSDRVMEAGELVRLDIGCEVGHYEGDLGRTIPVSGRYGPAQREVWTAFVAAYRAGAATLRAGATADSVYAVWREELLRQAPAVTTDLARRAIESWSVRDNVPFWQIHTTGIDIADAGPGLREGMTVAFEPIAPIDGTTYFMEDMYLVGRDGAELLTTGLPTTADEIEAAMRPESALP